MQFMPEEEGEAMSDPLKKPDWRWLAPDGVLHSLHPTRNSITACGLDWDGWDYLQGEIHVDQNTLCKGCQEVFSQPVAPATKPDSDECMCWYVCKNEKCQLKQLKKRVLDLEAKQ
jgi:hypothetical protein